MYSRKFQITAETNLPQDLNMPFGTIITKLKLVHVVERKMHHACTPNFRDKLPFVNSTKSLIFDLTKILLPKHLVLTYSCKGYVLSDTFYRIETELLVLKLYPVLSGQSFSKLSSGCSSLWKNESP